MVINNDGTIKLNCTECIEDNIIYYHKDSNMNICKYKYYEKQCVVKYCKTCLNGNNYFCSECLPADYEVSPLTGGCVKKVEKDPEVYFKDIFRLQLNQYKKIGARTLFGPFLSLRGLTNSQINTGHAFLVLLSFNLHYRRNRNLQGNSGNNIIENKTIKTYCQVVESTDETDGEPNIVDFDCIGDTNEEEDLSDYELNSIKEDVTNTKNKILGKSNLDELAANTNLEDIKKNKTSFKLQEFLDLAVFNPDNISNIYSENYKFNFSLNGKINKNITNQIINSQIPLDQINNKKAECIFKISENNKANLKCDLDFEEYKNISNNFSLKVTEISDSSKRPIYLSRINEVKLIHSEKVDANGVNEDDESNKKKTIIIIVVCVLAFAVAVSGLSLCRYYNCSKQKNNNASDEVQSRNHPNNDNENSERKVIKYQNHN
jgi:hypothetical protein